MKKRRLMVLLAAAALLSALSAAVFAEEPEYEITAPEVTAFNAEASGKVRLTWNAVEGALKYQVYRSDSPEGTFRRMFTTGGTSYTNSRGTPGETCYYKVRAVFAESFADSQIVSGRCMLAQPVLTVSNEMSTGKICLSWKPVDGAACYMVYWSDSPDGMYRMICSTIGTAYTHSPGELGKPLYFKVLAVGDDLTLLSAESQTVEGICRLPGTKITSATNDPLTGDVQLTWDPVSGAAGYTVYRSESKDGPCEAVLTTPDTSFTDLTAVGGTTYYYRVQALAEDESANSPMSRVRKRSCDCVAPEITASFNTRGKPRITWEPVEGAVTYKVYRAASEDGPFKLMYRTSGTSYSNTSAKAGVTYFYKVKAVGAESSTTSVSSNVVSGSVARGIVEIDGEKRFFTENGQELVVVNPWNYIPEDYSVKLVSIGNGHKLASEARDDYRAMMNACRKAGYDPVVVSSYRTHQYQAGLHARRISRFMAQGYSREKAEELAAMVVAVPGTSEHQLGLALDIVDSKNQSLDESQAKTGTQKWLMENSWQYGWILRYPEGSRGSTGIIYEPWHYRYVGRETAADIHASGLCLEDYLQALTADV